MRVTVGMIVEALAAGRTIEQLLFDFPYLEEEDIREALAFAPAWLRDTKFAWRVDCQRDLAKGAMVLLDWSGRPRARVLPLA